MQNGKGGGSITRIIFKEIITENAKCAEVKN